MRSERAEEFVEQLFLDNGYVVKKEVKIGRMRVDFLVEKDEKKYVLEVKIGDFDIGKIHAIAGILKEATISTEYIPIFILFNRRSCLLKEELERDYQVYVIDLSNLLYLVFKHEIMKNKLVSLLNFSIENRIEKELNFPIYLKQYSEYKEHDDSYVKRLDRVEPGNLKAHEYEKFCVEVLKYLFNDSLSLWEEQKKSNDDLFRFDLICKIKNHIKNEFFNTLEKYFSSKYIIFEFKNYIEEITQREIYTTEKYLYRTALRMVAIIITRNGIDKNGMKAIKGILRENGKLIIVLDDKDIKQMIKAKEQGEDYHKVLITKLDHLFVSLEK